LLEVYDAVGQEPLFAMHRGEPNLECPVGRGIRPALGRVYGEIEQALRRELARTSVADVLRDTLQAS
jgi:DNA-binding IscR family transcriptional regulator